MSKELKTNKQRNCKDIAGRKHEDTVTRCFRRLLQANGHMGAKSISSESGLKKEKTDGALGLLKASAHGGRLIGNHPTANNDSILQTYTENTQSESLGLLTSDVGGPTLEHCLVFNAHLPKLQLTTVAQLANLHVARNKY